MFLDQYIIKTYIKVFDQELIKESKEVSMRAPIRSFHCLEMKFHVV